MTLSKKNVGLAAFVVSWELLDATPVGLYSTCGRTLKSVPRTRPRPVRCTRRVSSRAEQTKHRSRARAQASHSLLWRLLQHG